MDSQKLELDGAVYDMLVAKITLSAKEHLEADALKSRNRIALFLTAGVTLFIAALTGVATFGLSTLKSSLTENTQASISANVPAAVKEALDVQLPVLRASIEASAKTAVAEQTKLAQEAWNRISLRAGLRERLEDFDRTGGFTDSEMKAVVSQLMSLSGDAEIRSTNDFEALLQRVIDHQFGAGRLDFFKGIESEFQPEIMRSTGMTTTMVIWLGRSIAYFPVLPKDLAGGKMQEEWDSLVADYHKYADASRENRFPEIPLIYDLVLACMLAQPEPVLTALISRIDDLTDQEFNSVTVIAEEFAQEDWRSQRDSETSRARQRGYDCATRLIGGPGLSPRARDALAKMIGEGG